MFYVCLGWLLLLCWRTCPLQVAVLMGTLVMLVSSCLLLLGRSQLGRLFSSELDVVTLTAQAVPPLAVSLIGEGRPAPESGDHISVCCMVQQ